MDRTEIREAMEEAELIRPRVVPVRLRSGEVVYDLSAGPPQERKTERCDGDDDAVAAAILALQE